MAKIAGKKGIACRVIGICCLVLFCVSAYMVISQSVQARKEKQAFDDLTAQIIHEEPSEKVSRSEASGTTDPSNMGQQDVPEDVHRYDNLYAQNPDLFGWISIEGTPINYPVMHTPDDPEHYLRRAFDGSYSLSGVPFLDADCCMDCGNYLIYGHNMKNGTMFASLLDYGNEEFRLEHPIIRFDTMDASGEYEVLAAFYAEIYRVEDQGVFRYYTYTDLTNEDVFNEYLQKVYDASLYETGVSAKYGDQLLTLSTCSYHAENGRFVVIARAI